MPLIFLGLAVAFEAIIIHVVSRFLLGKNADTYYGTATVAGLATYLTFHDRDGLQWWPALPMLIFTGVLMHWVSVKVHQRFGR